MSIPQDVEVYDPYNTPEFKTMVEDLYQRFLQGENTPTEQPRMRVASLDQWSNWNEQNTPSEQSSMRDFVPPSWNSIPQAAIPFSPWADRGERGLWDNMRQAREEYPLWRGYTDTPIWNVGEQINPTDIPAVYHRAGFLTDQQYELAKQLRWIDLPGFLPNLGIAGGWYPPINTIGFAPGQQSPETVSHELRHVQWDKNLTPRERLQFERDYSSLGLQGMNLPDFATTRYLNWPDWYRMFPGREVSEAYAELPNFLQPGGGPAWLWNYYKDLPGWEKPWWTTEGDKVWY